MIVIQPTFLYLSTEEAAQALGVSRARIRQFVLENRMKAHRLGGRNLAIEAAEIQRFKNLNRPHGRPKHKG